MLPFLEEDRQLLLRAQAALEFGREFGPMRGEVVEAVIIDEASLDPDFAALWRTPSTPIETTGRVVHVKHELREKAVGDGR